MKAHWRFRCANTLSGTLQLPSVYRRAVATMPERNLIRLRLLLPTVFALCAASTGARAQVLAVTVRDSAQQPIPDASLVLLDSRRRVYATARSSKNGSALMPRADTGRYSLLVRRFGFKAEEVALGDLAPNDTVGVRVILHRTMLVLDPVIVKAERDSLRHFTVFGVNLRATGGTIITPSQIDHAVLGARDLADVLQRTPIGGMRIDQRRRCLTSTRSFPARCLPAVVDGQLFVDGSTLSDYVLPEAIDYIVVLRGSEVGVRFGSVGMDGILLIATKIGSRRGPP